MSGNFFQRDRFFKLDSAFFCGSYNTVCNRMCGVLLAACTHGKKFVFVIFTGSYNFLKLEVTFCDGSGFIHNYSAKVA